MEKSIPNFLSVVIIFLVFLLPIVGFFTYSYIDKPPQPFLNYLGLGIIFLRWFEKGSLKMPTYLLLYGLFIIYTIIQDTFIVGTSFNVEYIRNSRFIGSFLLAIIIENMFVSEVNKDYFNKLSIGLIVVTLMVIIFQELIDNNFMVLPGYNTESIGTNTDRLVSIYSWVDNRMAFGVVFLPILALVLGEVARKNKNNYLLLFYFIGLLVSFLNRSRITLVQFFLLFFLIPIYQGLRLNVFVKYFVIGVVSIMGLFIGLKAINVNVDQIVYERILEQNEGGMLHGSAGTRLLAFEIFGKVFPQHPLFGKGKFFRAGGTNDIELQQLLGGRSYQIHVGYLSLLYYYGIIGGGFYLLFMISLAKKLYRDAKLTNMWAPFLCWLMYVVNNMTDVMFHFDFIGIIIVLVFNNFYTSNLSADSDFDNRNVKSLAV